MAFGCNDRTELVAFFQNQIVRGNQHVGNSAPDRGDADAAGLVDVADGPTGVLRSHDRAERRESYRDRN